MAQPLEPGEMLPTRRLPPLVGGEAVRVGPNRSRAQVLVVTHRRPCDDCTAYLASFGAVAERVKAEKAEVLAVVGPDWDSPPGDVEVPVLVDDGLFVGRLTPDDSPVVAVADRYGQLFRRFEAGAGHDFPEHDQVLRTLLDIALRCPECGVPDIPSPEVLPEVGTRSAGIHVHQ